MNPRRTPLPRLRRKTKRIDQLLRAHFGTPARQERRDPLSVLIQTILSQNTTDVNSGRAFASLRSRFPDWSDVLRARTSTIAQAIRSGGLAGQKSTRIKQILTWLHETRGPLSLDFICRMSTPEAMAQLTSLPGVGPKTASVLLLFACGKPVFPVDTHIHRVAIRLGLIPPQATAAKAHHLLGEIVPKGAEFPLHMNLIRHGRTVCRPRKPFCSKCPLNRMCPRVGVKENQ